MMVMLVINNSDLMTYACTERDKVNNIAELAVSK